MKQNHDRLEEQRRSGPARASKLWIWSIGLLLVLGSAGPSAADLQLQGGTALLQAAQSRSSFLSFSQLELDTALCGQERGQLGITAESLGSGPRTDPEAIRVYLDEQDKPHGYDDFSELGMTLDGAQKDAADQCGAARVFGEVTHLCLASVDQISTSCGPWSLAVALDPAAGQPVVDWTLQGSGGGGVFLVDITLKLLLTFSRVSPVRELEIRRTLVVTAAGPWSRVAGTGGFSSSVPFEVDADCDCRRDALVPPTGDFHPGWEAGDAGFKAGDGGQLTPVPFCFHDPEGDARLCFEPFMPQPPGEELR